VPSRGVPRVFQQPASDLPSGRELTWRLKIIGVSLAGFAVMALVASLLLGLMVCSLVARVPVKWEQELGDKLMAELKEEETFVEDAKLQTNLVRAVAPLGRN
jgi:predicted Zn-dependent protease